MSTLHRYIRNQYSSRVLIPVANIRKQGFSSETLALSISIGIIGGAFPVLGLASYVCLLLTLGLKQNIIIVQVANWLVYPLQLLLMIPLMKLGNSVFAGGDLTITMHQIAVAFESGILHGIKLVGVISLYGIVAWAVFAIPTVLILYSLFLILFRVIKRMKLKSKMVLLSNPQAQVELIIPVTQSLIHEPATAIENGL